MPLPLLTADVLTWPRIEDAYLEARIAFNPSGPWRIVRGRTLLELLIYPIPVPLWIDWMYVGARRLAEQ